MDYIPESINDPVLPSQNEVKQAKETHRKLAAHIEPEKSLQLTLQNPKGDAVSLDLPASAVQLLLNILEQMSHGNAVALTPLQAELSTNQAAALLRVSRPYLIKILDEGKIPYRKVGRHRRILARDLLAYKQKSYQGRTKRMAELTAEAQEHKWGYD